MALAQQLTAAGWTSGPLGLNSIQPVALLLAVAGLAWYLRLRRQVLAGGRTWSWLRTGSWLLGLLLLIAVTCGPVQHYGRYLYWVWVSQSLALLLVVPLPLMCGQPIELVRAGRADALLPRLADSTVGRWFSSPLLGPALVPVVCVASLFGPVPGWVAGQVQLGWLVQVALLLIGALIVLPLVAVGDLASSAAVGVAVAIGVLELLIDAVPGIVLRLSTHPVSSYFSARDLGGASALPWLHDQQIGGGVLWCVAELLDLPFLLLVFRRWVRADAREAAAIDEALDLAELTGHRSPSTDPDAPPEPQQPWFVNDPRLRDRLR